MVRPILAGLFAATAVPALAQVAPPVLAAHETLLEVSANGTAYAVPDRATIRGGVTTVDTDARGAVNANATAMDQVVAALKREGIAPADIRTERVALHPIMANVRDQGVPRITGYRAINSVTVTLRKLDNGSDVVTGLFAAGANEVNGPYFALNDDGVARDAARKDAIARARAEAESYAAAFGMRIGRVLRISERAGGPRYGGDIVVTGSRMMAPAPPPPPAPNVPVSVGQMTVTAQVWVDFALTAR